MRGPNQKKTHHYQIAFDPRDRHLFICLGTVPSHVLDSLTPYKTALTFAILEDLLIHGLDALDHDVKMYNVHRECYSGFLPLRTYLFSFLCSFLLSWHLTLLPLSPLPLPAAQEGDPFTGGNRRGEAACAGHALMSVLVTTPDLQAQRGHLSQVKFHRSDRRVRSSEFRSCLPVHIHVLVDKGLTRFFRKPEWAELEAETDLTFNDRLALFSVCQYLLSCHLTLL